MSIMLKDDQLEQVVSEWIGTVRRECYTRGAWASMSIGVTTEYDEDGPPVFCLVFLPKYNTGQREWAESTDTCMECDGLIRWATSQGWSLIRVDYWCNLKALDLGFVSTDGVLWRVRMYSPRPLSQDVPTRGVQVEYANHLDRQESLQVNLAAAVSAPSRANTLSENLREIDL